jgi:14-3-3 protein
MIMEQLMFRARVAECAERFEEMFEVVREIADYKNAPSLEDRSLMEDYNHEERVLVSTCFKNLISRNQQALATVNLVVANPKYENRKDYIEVYQRKLQWDVQAQCRKVINLIKETILENAEEMSKENFAYFT